MAKRKKVWGVFYYYLIPCLGVRGWIPNRACESFRKKKDALRECASMYRMLSCRYTYTAIPGTVRQDGSISWPKEWPVP
jgi:hypothetical protein